MIKSVNVAPVPNILFNGSSNFVGIFKNPIIVGTVKRKVVIAPGVLHDNFNALSFAVKFVRLPDTPLDRPLVKPDRPLAAAGSKGLFVTVDCVSVGLVSAPGTAGSVVADCSPLSPFIN